jgi:hypothetical protein
MDLLSSYGKETNDKEIEEYAASYMETKKAEYFKQLASIPHRVCYPEEWAQPRPFDTHWQQVLMKRIHIVPYKRISHFREHLNRLQFTQFITIPNKVINMVKQCITKYKNSPSRLYYHIKQTLKRYKMTKYNEHIHYITSEITKKYIQISYDDHHDMWRLFLELEQQFCKKQRGSKQPRKNMISYYLIIQLVLYLFHYHPAYKLPSIRDTKKRESLYCELLTLFTQAQCYQEIITLHFKRKKDCKFCHYNEHTHHFDQHLISIL